MPDPIFLQFHTLTSYPGTLLNRDDAGFAKRLPFGGTTRTRVSSQCLKYHWRNFDGQHALYGMDVPRSLRSRETFQRLVAQPLIDDGYPPALVRAITFVIKELVLTGKAPGRAEVQRLIEAPDEKKAWAQLETNQITILGYPEVRYLRRLAADMLDGLRGSLAAYWNGASQAGEETAERATEAVRQFPGGDLKKNLKGLRLASGLDAGLFGRMVTSDLIARGDAAVHVAHAFTTHEEESESDYFSAVDELRRDEPGESGELGAGYINSQELTSGLFYNYVVVDVPLLVSNLEGVDAGSWREADPALAAEVVKRLVHLVATVSPGAKLGSTAPHAYAQCVIVEAGAAQPRTLANAFQRAVPTDGPGVLANSYSALGRHVGQMDVMYGRLTERRLAAIEATEELVGPLGTEGTSSVADVAVWAGRQVGGDA